MPINRPYDPRYNAKLYVPKLTEEQRRARATPLENLRGVRYRSDAPVALPSTPEPASPEPTTPEPTTPKPAAPQPTTPELATPESITPEPVAQGAPAPDYIPTGREVVFAQFPELYPHHAELAVAAPGEAHTPHPQAPLVRRCVGVENAQPEAAIRHSIAARRDGTGFTCPRVTAASDPTRQAEHENRQRPLFQFSP